jgi:hypothetical protein
MKNHINEIDKFIDKKCYDAMYKSVSCYVEDNPNALELSCTSNFVDEPDGATLTDMEIIKTENCVIDEDEITFNTIVSCELEIEETVRRNRETDCASQWFRLKCRAVLHDTLKSFTVTNVEVYSK